MPESRTRRFPLARSPARGGEAAEARGQAISCLVADAGLWIDGGEIDVWLRRCPRLVLPPEGA